MPFSSNASLLQRSLYTHQIGLGILIPYRITPPWHRNSMFFKALAAPHTALQAHPRPYAILQDPDSSSTSGDRIPLSNLIDQSRMEIDEKDEEEVDLPQDLRLTPPPDSQPAEFLEVASSKLWEPSLKWKWLETIKFPFNEPRYYLNASRAFTSYIASSILGGQRITYKCNCWKLSQIRPAMTELTLFKNQLHALQGSVTPMVMNVYHHLGELVVVTELPHRSFWIEASSEMPEILKKRCVEALGRVHSCGVLHGKMELSKFLINGNGAVTIIDFEESRIVGCKQPNPLFGSATDADLKMEMQMLRYLLDYNDARRKEEGTLKEIYEKAEAKSKLRRQAGELYPVAPDESEPNSSVILQRILAWSEICDAEKPPRRYVIPGQTNQALETNVQRFIDSVTVMAAKDAIDYGSSLDSRRPPRPPPPTSSLSVGTTKPRLTIGENVTPLQESLGKRKASADAAVSLKSPKRARNNESHAPKRHGVEVGFFGVPTSSAGQSSYRIAKEREDHIGRQSIARNNRDRRFPPIKVFDYVNEGRYSRAVEEIREANKQAKLPRHGMTLRSREKRKREDDLEAETSRAIKETKKARTDPGQASGLNRNAGVHDPESSRRSGVGNIKGKSIGYGFDEGHTTPTTRKTALGSAKQRDSPAGMSFQRHDRRRHDGVKEQLWKTSTSRLGRAMASIFVFGGSQGGQTETVHLGSQEQESLPVRTAKLVIDGFWRLIG